MARMAFAIPAPAVAAARAAAALWSIDNEPMGPGWHDSSWQLRRGLVVDEEPPPDAIPPEWQWRWWIASFSAA